MGKPRKKIRGKPSKERSCEGKQRFESEDEAEKASFRPRKMNQAIGFMKAYKCRFCYGWHYGHVRTSA